MNKIYTVLNEVAKVEESEGLVHVVVEIVSNLTGEVFAGSGYAKCAEEDKFNAGVGINIARDRAYARAIKKYRNTMVRDCAHYTKIAKQFGDEGAKLNYILHKYEEQEAFEKELDK